MFLPNTNFSTSSVGPSETFLESIDILTALARYKKSFSTNLHKNVKVVGRGAAARGVTVKPTGCGFDPHSRR